jgi:hypothetical protein
LPDDAQRAEAQNWVRQTFSWERSGSGLLSILESNAGGWRQRLVFRCLGAAGRGRFMLNRLAGGGKPS